MTVRNPLCILLTPVAVVKDDQNQKQIINDQDVSIKFVSEKSSILVKEKSQKINKDSKSGKNLPQVILDKLSKTCKLELVNELEDSMKFNIKKFKKLSDVFDECEKLVLSNQIEGFWVSEMNLEDIFLICSNDHEKEVNVLDNLSESLK